MTLGIRKSIYDLTAPELLQYRNALQAVKDNGTYDKQVRMHAVAMARKTPPVDTIVPAPDPGDIPFLRNTAHRGPSFLPWHRHYIRELEKAMQAEVPGVMLPYWPWERDSTNFPNTTDSPLWTDAYLGSKTDCPYQNAPDYCRVGNGLPGAWNVLRQAYLTNAAGEFIDANGNLAQVFADLVPLTDADGDPILVDGGAVGDPDRFGLFRVLGDRNITIPAGTFAFRLPTQAEVDAALEFDTYDSAPWDTSVTAANSFRNRLEGFAPDPSLPVEIPPLLTNLHNIVHNWIGGDMGPGTSPNDPVFYLHHCNVDRIWARWQEKQRLATGGSYASHYQPQAVGPDGHKINEPMFPWNNDPKFPGEPVLSPMMCLDYANAHEFIYDDLPIVSLTTPSVDFGEVIQDETQYRAAVFSVLSAYPVQFEIVGFDAGAAPAPSFSETDMGLFEAVPDPVTYESEGLVWIAYEAGAPGPVPGNQSVEIRAFMNHPNSGLLWQHTFVVALSAASKARPVLAAMLVLDQSGSMDWDAGNGQKRVDVLKFSAPPFVELMDVGNALGIVAFDHNAHDRMDIKALPAAMAEALGVVADHEPNPVGGTSIADGIERAHEHLNALVPADLGEPFASADTVGTAIVVLTDGHETSAKWLDQLDASSLTSKVFAVALGTAEVIQPDKLVQITGSTEGYVQLTGTLSAGGDDTDLFLLTKYYLQILADLTNAQVSEDPEGRVGVGEVERVPFVLTEADYGADVILLTEVLVIDMVLETPTGQILDMSLVGVVPQVRHVEGRTMQAYRLRLPAPIDGVSAHAGTWHAVLRLDPQRAKKWLAEEIRPFAKSKTTQHLAARMHGGFTTPEVQEKLDELRDTVEEIVTRGARYSLNVHTRSNLNMQAAVHQHGYEPGSTMLLRAQLTEYAVPVNESASVRAKLDRPDGTQTSIDLARVEPGIFEASLTATMAGTWRFRLLAKGKTRRNQVFTRERLLSAGIWHSTAGGPSIGDLVTDLIDRLDERDERMCRLLGCVLGDDGLRKRLESEGIDTEHLMRCLKEFCRREKPAEKDVRLRLANVLRETKVMDALKLVAMSVAVEEDR